MEFYGPHKTDKNGNPSQDMQPKILSVADGKNPDGSAKVVRITLDLQPLPVMIPRQSVGTAMQTR
ncbi:MAG: hypothetical protein QM811_02435 [Pirellulales bacterium]